MNRADIHYLNCDDRDCEKIACVDRRETSSKIDALESKCAWQSVLLKRAQKIMETMLSGITQNATTPLQWFSDLENGPTDDQS